jgi:hypothetical protein
MQKEVTRHQAKSKDKRRYEVLEIEEANRTRVLGIHNNR